MDSSYIICECGEQKGDHKVLWEQYTDSLGQPMYGCALTHCPVFSAARIGHNQVEYESGQRLLWRR